jgi:hypothetical protein
MYKVGLLMAGHLGFFFYWDNYVKKRSPTYE